MSPDEEVVLYEKRDAVAFVTLNRPAVLNAYNVAMRDRLFEILSAVRDDSEVRVVVLRGHGSSFCSGGDLTEFGSAPSPLVARAVRWQRDVWGLLRGLSQVTIAAVHGHAIGSGFEMALLCDFRIAASDVLFRLPETGRGMIPGVGGTQSLSRLLRIGRALELVLTGRGVGAREAADLGLVNTVCAPEQLPATAFALAARVTAFPPTLISSLKRAVYESLDLPLRDGLALERRLADRWLSQS